MVDGAALVRPVGVERRPGFKRPHAASPAVHPYDNRAGNRQGIKSLANGLAERGRDVLGVSAG